MTQKTTLSKEGFESQVLRVLILYQGYEASAYVHPAISYLSKFKEIEVVSPMFSPDFSVDIFSQLNKSIDTSDAAIAIVACDLRPASSAGNIWFEMGIWLGRKRRSDNLLILAAKLPDGSVKAPSDLHGRAIMRFEEKEDLFRAINVFLQNQLKKKRKKEKEIKSEKVPRWDSPTQVEPVFISYSHNDSDFVDLLSLNLDKAGISYWRDIHDAPAGPLDDIIDDAMHRNPTVILVLSKDSVESDWVEDEATRARKLSKELNRHVLCPIALDDSWKSCSWAKKLRTQLEKYNILSFHGWRTSQAFSKMMEKLIKGLSIWY